MSMPTSADVAKRANVSRATVSYVLNGVTTQKISEKTREAVQRAADELGYRPNLAAQSLASGGSRLALFVIPGVHLGELAIFMSSHLTARAAERGMNLIVHFDSTTESTVIDIAKDLRPRVVFSMFALDPESDRWLRGAGIQVASFFPSSGPSTMIGDRTGSLQVAHLAAAGHTRIAFATTEETGLQPLARARCDGVAVACRDLGLEEPLSAGFRLDAEGAEHTVRAWARQGVTAVAAYNDEVAVAVLAGIRRAGLHCPDDMAVIGVDDMSINPSMEPPLSSIAFDVEGMAAAYADALAEALDGKAVATDDVGDTSFMRVMARKSTAALGA